MAGSIRGPERRIVLMGKTGNGKSATGNTILGGHIFESKMSFGSGTKCCQREETMVSGRKVVVVDTPGFLDTGHRKSETAAEVKKCVKFCTPGPHVILQVIRPGRFTQEEEEVAQLIKEIFSLNAKKYMILLFTRKEDLEGKTLDQFISEGNCTLKEQVYLCGKRYLAFNNKAEGAEREAQVAQLMEMIDELVKRNRSAPCYTEEMLAADKENFKSRLDLSWLCPFLYDSPGCCAIRRLEMAGSIQGPERRIVLVGKTGNGKSATGNTILGSTVFKSKVSSVSVTKRCQKEETQVNGRKVVVVDTPGFLDTRCCKSATAAEVKKCVSFCTPGPHVILQVMHLGRFTQEEQDVAQLIKEIFSLNAKNYMILLFTRKEDLEGEALDQFISEGDRALKEQVKLCGDRYLAFNNKAQGAEREAQVAQLMEMIDGLVKENRDAPCYTEEMLVADKESFKSRLDLSWLCPLL
ncbi:GTPase IMAP family member 8-like [Protobothrops mucrosquamatus]|uniref:GTPase IMAP family member 8-like n=1 Tax=Protobothrops mucrosquamatus TaxID=103944 RepID=UPI0010FAEE55|nr:GTPase IMAP family member 8-like [Protobothrops mucrosquamatus]